MDSTLDIRAQARELYKEHGSRIVARILGVGRTTVQRWCHDQVETRANRNSKLRKKVEHPCIGCNNPTTNPRFCSIRCAVISNNRKRAKEHITKTPKNFCPVCQKPIARRDRYCIEHYPRKDWTAVTIGELRKSKNYHKRIRDHARASYFAKYKPQCQRAGCGYTLNIHIAHLTSIASWPDSAPVSTINDLRNLAAICPNHHWEFDNGHITMNDLLSPSPLS